MTPSELKAHVEQGTESHFFTRATMKFFGDNMKNYGVRSATIETDSGPVECWELYRRRPVKHGLQSSAYFRKDDFSRVWSKD